MSEPSVPAAAREIIDRLELEPHPEGGWFRQTFRDDDGANGAHEGDGTRTRENHVCVVLWRV